MCLPKTFGPNGPFSFTSYTQGFSFILHNLFVDPESSIFISIVLAVFLQN